MNPFDNNKSKSQILSSFNGDITSTYTVKQGVDTKKGLRNADGTGVLIGTTAIGSVQGYTIDDGERVPAEGLVIQGALDSELDLLLNTFTLLQSRKVGSFASATLKFSRETFVVSGVIRQ